MNTRVTWLLLCVALALGGYVLVTERRLGLIAGNRGQVAFAPIDPARVTAIELLRSNTVVRVERHAGQWTMRLPVAYPAQGSAIEALLAAWGKVKPNRWLSPAELTAGGPTNSLAAFGLETGAITVKLETDTLPILLKLGGAAPIGDQYYLQRVGTEGVFIIDGTLFASLPRSADYWRDRSLFDLRGETYDRLEVRGQTPGFEAQKNAAGQWLLTKPLNARADGARLESLINTLRTTRVVAFLSDAPNVDLEPLGLQPPENEFILSRGTNELVRLQVGNRPADATNYVRVRLPATTNLVLVPLEVGQLARLPLPTFRDRQLLPPLTGLNRIELRAGTNATTLEARGTNWLVTAPTVVPADPDLVHYWLGQLPDLTIADYANDVVTDYATYGFDQPQREYRFFAGTNLLVHLQFGKLDGPEHLFARRLDEPAVYSVALGAFLQQPEAASQFRDLRFVESNVVQIAVSRRGKTRTLARNPQGEWTVAAGTPASTFTPAVEETLHRLGALQAVRYAVPDESQFTRLPSYRQLGHEFTLTFAPSAPLRTLRLRFIADLGSMAVALVQVDGSPESLRLDLPGPLAQELQREFGAD